MTVTDLLADLYEAFLFGATQSGTAVATRFTRHLEKAHKAIMREPGLARLRDTLSPLTFASEASRAIYGLPAALERVTAISERANNRTLIPMTMPELRALDPGLTATGSPSHEIPLGYRVIAQPPASTGLWAVSSAAGDTTQSLQVNGIRSSNLQGGDVNTTLNGITRVALGTFTDYVDVQVLALSAVCVGTVTIYNAVTAGNVIAQIAIGQTSPQYFCVQLWPTPSAAITYYVDGTLRLVGLSDVRDVPWLPDEFQDALMPRARMYEYEFKGDTERWRLAKLEYDEAVSDLKYAVSAMANDTPTLGRSARRGLSRLGGQYPADRW